MSQSFTHSADSLQSFFSQPGRGFYIPYYQRNYSWDEENAEKLVTDIFSGIKRTLTKPSNSIFLGTVILHDEKNVTVGTHTDTPNLLTKVSNVVDGQQRITSIAMLACALSHSISNTVEKLNLFNSLAPEFAVLASELENEQPEISEFFSVEIKKNGVQPRLKPLIIRAGDVTSNPVSDQWTLAGMGKNFYRSNTSTFLSQFIDGIPLANIQSDDRVGSVLEVFQSQIDGEVSGADFSLANGLFMANGVQNGSLSNFMAYPPNLANIQVLPSDAQSAFYGGMLLLAACSFLKNSCHLVVIECLDLGLAFDMFQSLNATGTPLTAFEVFKPVIVRAWGANYATEIKPEVDRIERVFETESTASGKEELTDKVIVSSALIYNGEVISKKFSDERDWLFNTLPQPPQALAKDFVACIADQAEYCSHFIQPRKSPKNAQTFGLVNYLQGLGLNALQADMSALCIFFLRDAGHQFAHSVLSVFYAKLLRAQGNTAAVAIAAAEFQSVCKATAAFFTLWMGAQQGRFPDSDYRQLFQSSTANMSVMSGVANQNEAFVKGAFRRALAAHGIYDAANVSAARQLWVDQAKESAWYSRKSVCRFALFVASHDAAPDLSAGSEGLFTNGMPNSANFLNCRAWHAREYEVIEHVATRDQPSTIKFPAHFDQTIYPGNFSVVDKIGNLTLLSVQVNSSVYSEWPDKVYYYWSLTTPSNTASGPSGTALMTALGLTSIPPGLRALTAASNYLPHLAPLAYRGESGLKWDANFIDQRSEHICGRVFDKLDAWLR
ncbi:DUF262 domain-containing protein [Burkholderia cepacia]|nr:DUF262 domain-containing protein [Burkholderia cepacia]